MKYIIADIINGLYIAELDGTEKVYADIDDFIEDIRFESTFDSGPVAIEHSEENAMAIEDAGYGFNDELCR